jgi:DM DNA binding domain-containing protein
MLDSFIFITTFLICLKCQVHNNQSMVNHKTPACPYKVCSCERCTVIETRRQQQNTATKRNRGQLTRVFSNTTNEATIDVPSTHNCDDDLPTKRTRADVLTDVHTTSPLHKLNSIADIPRVRTY